MINVISTSSKKCSAYALAVSFFSLTACGTPEEPVGADRDVYGCIGSAGYSWCAKTQSCERPWELAKKVGFDDTGLGFAKYCSQP